MPHKTFTHKDLAKHLGVSETTVKSYRRKFPGCIPLYSHGKPIRFSHDALAVCKKIRDLFEHGMSIEEVRSRLALEFSWIEPAEKQVSHTEEPKFAGVNALEGSPLPLQDEQKEFYTKADGFVSLPQSFTTAISGLAKSVVALTRQQSAILERLAGLEEKITPGFSGNFQTQLGDLEGDQLGGLAFELKRNADGTSQSRASKAEGLNPEFLTNPKWADDLASRLEGMEQALVRTLASFEGQFNAAQELIEAENPNFSPASSPTSPVSSPFSQDVGAQSSFGSTEPPNEGPASQRSELLKAGVNRGAPSEFAPGHNGLGQSEFAPGERAPGERVPGEFIDVQSDKPEEFVSSDPKNSTVHFRAHEPGQQGPHPSKDTEKGRVLPWNDKEGGSSPKIFYKPQAPVSGAQSEQFSQKEQAIDSSQHPQSSSLEQEASAKLPLQHDQNISQACKPTPFVLSNVHSQERYSEDFLRHISTLPLAISVSGDHVSISGRAPFSLNDLKAILAQTFSPPEHYVGKWETASGECWYILEQPEVEDGDNIRLHLRPVLNRRNAQMLELVRFMVGGVYEHPSSLYSFVQEWLG